MSDIDVLIDRLANMSPDAIATAVKDATSIVGAQAWLPNAGPQTDAYFCKADELFYGGQAGGGKSDLVVGLGLTAHESSLILRRFGADAEALADRAMIILGNRDGWNGQKLRLRVAGSQIMDFGGCKEENDKQRYKGVARDFYGFDEIGDFLESQYRFIIGWNRSADLDQRCRVVATGNPPTTAEGLWVISYWGPWLDPGHSNPASPGELRWYTTIGGRDEEVSDSSPIPDPDKPGKWIQPRSRTFIPSTLDDNPDLAQTNYASVLAALPEAYRSAYRDGNFDVAMKDKSDQMIPTQWVRDAMDRWEPHAPTGIPMCTIAADVAQGGGDKSVFARRHDGWFAKLVEVPGIETPDGPAVASRILGLRRNEATIVVDAGGGYGGSTIDHLKDNGLKPYAYKGAAKSLRSTQDKTLKFVNRRAEAYWKLREALDPSQYQGSPLALPPDQELLADLTTPTFEVTASGIKMMIKKDVVKLLGRSPDKGDAVVMCWFRGPTAATHLPEWRNDQGSGTVGHRRKPKVNMGGRHAIRRRK